MFLFARSRHVLRFVVLVVLLAPVMLRAPIAQAQATFVVQFNNDLSDVNPGNGTCDTSPTLLTNCGIRAAIEEANALPGEDRIEFGRDGVNTVTLSSDRGPLPAITEAVIIDGTTTPSYDDDAPAPQFYIDGSDLTATNADGLRFVEGSSASTVRGLGIINFPDDGIHLTAEAISNLIQGCHIGVSDNGASAGDGDVGNTGYGINIESSTNLIGGDTPRERNVLSGNRRGIRIVGDYNVVRGNFIGTTPDGSSARPNRNGILIYQGAQNNRIGGLESGVGNVISGNRFTGLIIRDAGTTGNRIEGNHIGTDSDGSAPLGNGTSGVSVLAAASNNIIGGVDPGAGNVIAFNGPGVRLRGSTEGNAVRRNAIFSNGRLGIDLGGDLAPTPNDPGDGDTGPNNLQNFPEITSVDYDPSRNLVLLTYRVDTDPAHAAYPLRVEFFRVDADREEGEAFLGENSYTESDFTEGPEKSIAITPEVPVTEASSIVATATDANGNTSEFSTQATRLPVELVSFEGQVEESDVVLAWQTASETNNAGFAVQRREARASGSAGAWEQIAFVQSKAPGRSSSTALRYRFTDETVPFAAETLAYRLKQIDTDGASTFSEEIEFALGVPERLALHPPFPNPVAGQTTIRYALPQASDVHLAVYDALGRRVALLVNGEQPAGRKERTLDARRLPSGLYFVRLTSEGARRIRKLAVVQ